MFIPRQLENSIRNAAKGFPILSVTGPRQSGKTTMLRTMFADYRYISLENPDYYEFAMNDPRRFLAQYDRYVILDEVQRVPHLFNYLQGKVDEDRIMAQYILSGSQNYLLMSNITQSLAGRVALFRLLPFSFEELKQENLLDHTLENSLYKGFYPALFDRDLSPSDFYPNYFDTYIQRDVRTLQAVHDLSLFQKFVRLCAGRIGQPLNYVSLASDTGISSVTAKAWLSILETSHIIFTLPPYFKNFNKRLTKAHKLYFYDSGLAAYLLGVLKPDDLNTHFARGNLFENMIVAELHKRQYHQGLRPHLYYWQESNSKEIDLLWEQGTQLNIAEIKSAATINSAFFTNLNYFKKLSQGELKNTFLIYGGSETQYRSEATVLAWYDAYKAFP